MKPIQFEWPRPAKIWHGARHYSIYIGSNDYARRYGISLRCYPFCLSVSWMPKKTRRRWYGWEPSVSFTRERANAAEGA